MKIRRSFDMPIIDYNNIHRINENIAEYQGYTIHRDGRVVSPNGKELNAFNFTYEKSHVTLNIDNVNVKYNRALLVWHCFSDTPINIGTEIIRFKDGDTSNAAFDNLLIISRRAYYQEMDIWHRHITNEIKDTIRSEYGNGSSLRKLSRKYKYSLSTIQKIVNQKGSN